MSKLQKLGLVVSRFALPFWVGASVLFLVNAVGLTAGFKDVKIRDEMALIRFPALLICGFSSVGAAFLGLLLAGAQPTVGGAKRRKTAVTLTFLALLLMAWDYVYVYKPLEALITPPGKTRTEEFKAQFRKLHGQSMMLNLVHVGLCGLAGLIWCWPGSSVNDR